MYNMWCVALDTQHAWMRKPVWMLLLINVQVLADLSLKFVATLRVGALVEQFLRQQQRLQTFEFTQI